MTKAKSQLACDPRVMRAARATKLYTRSARTIIYPTSSYVAEITHPFAMADRGS